MAETSSIKDNKFVKEGSSSGLPDKNRTAATTTGTATKKEAVPKRDKFMTLGDDELAKIRSLINQQPDSEREKYAYDTALDLARREQENDRRTRGFVNFNSEADLTSKADDIYDQLMPNAKMSGSDMRGENVFTQALGGLREGLNGFNNMIGTGLDWGVDRVGDLVGLVSGRDDWRQSIQDATTGEDLAIIPSIAEDLGIIALTGPIGAAGILGAKGLIENSDNLQEAFTGRDHITGEDLTGSQRMANAAAGLGGTALTMLPGMSAAKASRNLIGDELVEKAAKAGEKLAEATSKAEPALKSGYKPAMDNAEKLISQATEKEAAAKAAQEAFAKFASVADENGKMTAKEAMRLATRNPFSKEAREYNKAAKEAYARRFKESYNLNRYGIIDPDTGKLLELPDENGVMHVVQSGNARKALWNLINGRTPAYATKFDEQAAINEAKGIIEKAGDEAADAAKKATKGRLNAASIFKNTNGKQGRGMVGLNGPGGILGFGLTAGSGLSEAMANTPGGFSEAVGNLSDQIGQASDAQLLPLALAMFPGYRRGFARMFGGNTLPYYAVKGQLAQRGVDEVNIPRYNDLEEDNLLKAINVKEKK